MTSHNSSFNSNNNIDYSKWDHILDDESSVEEEVAVVPPPSKSCVTKIGSEKGRYRFEYEGRLIYEWDQNLDEVNIYVHTPSNNMTASHISCQIQANHLRLGLVGSNANQSFLDEQTYSKVVVAESSWFLSDGIIQIVLTKANRGLTWESALLGRMNSAVDPFTKQSIQKEMMLERFQEENPGFDFRDAKFNGSIPDPRTFMGGIGYD